MTAARPRDPAQRGAGGGGAASRAAHFQTRDPRTLAARRAPPADSERTGQGDL